MSTGVPYVGLSGGAGLLFAPIFCGASLQLTKGLLVYGYINKYNLDIM